MSLAALPERRPTPSRQGHARFIAAARSAEACAELRAQRFLVAGVAALCMPPLSLSRGRLREVIDEAVEGALAMRGALPPNVCVGAELGATIRDQVFRTSALGMAGLALALPRLRDMMDDRGELEATDAEALAAWMTASREGPVVLLLDEGDRSVRIRVPVALGQLVSEAPAAARPAPVKVAVVEAPIAPAADVAAPVAPAVDVAPVPLEAPLKVDAPAEIPRLEPRHERAERPVFRAPDAPPAELSAEEPPRLPRPAQRRVAPPVARVAQQQDPSLEPEADARPPRPRLEPAELPLPVRAPEADARAPRPRLEPAEPAPPKPLTADTSAERVLSAAERRAFALELDSARGPKPAKIIDQLYATRYIPLLAAVMRGEADGFVRSVVDAWRASFEHSYRESFATIRVTGKRPPMVFDAPEVAAKIGRLNGARAVRLVLVDGMSFDLGERVMGRLKDRVASSAVCVEQTLLWAALPSTTPQQLALLARGEGGLREGAEPGGDEAEIARGRAVSTIRRERVGTREVMRLECVEARLRNAGPAYDERLDGIADETSQVLARFIEGQKPRTLLFVFGDHGFRMTPSADGRSTSAATQGGASPEEVLVPGHSWLVGGVH